MNAKPGVQTTQILRAGNEMHSKSVTLRPGSVQEVTQISGWGSIPDPTDAPYVQAGAVSRVRLSTGEVMWVTSSPKELTPLSAWPP